MRNCVLLIAGWPCWGIKQVSGRADRKEESGSCSQMQKLRERSREMSKVYGAEGRQGFWFLYQIQYRILDSPILTSLSHKRLYSSYFFSKLMQKVLKAIEVILQAIFCFEVNFPLASVFSDKFSRISRNCIQVSDLVSSQYFIEIHMQKTWEKPSLKKTQLEAPSLKRQSVFLLGKRKLCECVLLSVFT